MMNFGGYIGGALAPTITGFIVQRTGSFEQALLLGAFIALVGAASYILIVRQAPIQVTELEGHLATA